MEKFNFMKEPYGEDVIAIVLIIAFVILKFKGIESGLDNVLILIGGFYFGTSTEKRNKNL